jgi:hypothetical protein
LGFRVARVPVDNAKPDAKPDGDLSPQTMILGRWQFVTPNLKQIWEFTKEGVVNRTSTVIGTNIAPDGTAIALPGGMPVILGSVSQSGKYAFVTNKSVHIDMKQAAVGIINAPAWHGDWDLVRIASTAMLVNSRTETGDTFEQSFEKVK